MQPVTKLLHALHERRPILPQHVHDRPLHLQRLQAHADRQAGLAVQVNEQYPFPGGRHGRPQVVRRGGLGHAALLVCDCNYLHHVHSFISYVIYLSYILYFKYIIYSCYIK